MMRIKLKDEYITLGQALKAAGVARSGAEAKIFIQNGLADVNGEKELRRGRKLYAGDEIKIQGEIIKIAK